MSAVNKIKQKFYKHFWVFQQKLFSLFRIDAWRIWIVVILACFGMYTGTKAWDEAPPINFYQDTFASAVSYGCGHGYKNIVFEKNNIISDFLNRRSETLTCDEAFSSENAPMFGEKYILQDQTPLLQRLFGVLWAMFGFSWDLGKVVAALLTGGLVISVFAFSRLLLGFWPSIIISGFVAFGVGNFAEYIPHLRDYSKAPFMIGLAAMLIAFTLSDRKKLPLLSFWAACLTVAGVGFRSDVSLFLALFPLVLALKATLPINRSFALKGLGVFVITAIALNFVAFNYSEGLGRNNAHFAVLGHTPIFFDTLGVDPQHGYSSHYNDLAAHDLVSRFEHYAGRPKPGYGTDAYDEAGMGFLTEMLKTFPATEMSMGFAAVHLSLFRVFEKYNVYSAVSMLIVFFGLALFYQWRGIVIIAVVGFLSGLTGIQFSERHHFYFDQIGIILVVAVLLTAIFWVSRVTIGKIKKADRFTQFTRFANASLLPNFNKVSVYWSFFPLLLILTYFLSLPLAIHIQINNVEAIHDKMSGFHKTPLTQKIIESKDTVDAVQVFDLSFMDDGTYVQFVSRDPQRCPSTPNLKAFYQASAPYYDSSFMIKPASGQFDTVSFYLPFVGKQYQKMQKIEAYLPRAECALDGYVLHPDKSFLPLVYYGGDDLKEKFVDSGANRLVDNFTEFQKFSMGNSTCLVQQANLTGRTGVKSVEKKLIVPNFVSVDVTDNGDGISSDHFDIGNPKLVVDGEVYHLSTFKFIKDISEVYKTRRNSNIIEKPLKISDQVYGNGFGMHAPSSFVLAIPKFLRGKQGELSFDYGVDAQTQGAGSVAVDICVVR